MTPRCHRTPHPSTPAKPGAQSANENQFTALVDAEGYVVGGSVSREKTTDFLHALRALPRYELPEIVAYAPGWPLGMTAMEYERQDVERIAPQAPNGALSLTDAPPVARSA
jgi:hypothetical protein